MARTKAQGLSNSPSKTTLRTPKEKIIKASSKDKGKEPVVNNAHDPEILEGSGETPQPWSWVTLADPSPSRVSPIISNDGSYFFAVVGGAVKVHVTATGQVVSTLSPESTSSSTRSSISHSDQGLQITGLLLNPDNPFQLLTSSLDGAVRVWDYMEGIILQTIDLGQPVYCIAAHASQRGYVFVAAGRPPKNGSTLNAEDCSVLRVSLKPTEPSIQSPRQKSSEVIPIGKLKSPAGLALSSSGEWLVAIGAHRVYVIKTSRLKSGLTKFTSPERLVSLAFHPSEDYFATGDEKGVIRSWFCLKDELMGSSDTEKRAQTTTLHWHAHAVSCLAFASNGAYLLSGGEEAVLVLWQLQSGKKEYVPRVGAPIAGLAVSRSQDREEEYLLALTDGSHLFVSSASLKISRSFSMLKFDPSSSTPGAQDIPAPLAYHAQTSTLILPSSHPTAIQAYVPSSSSLFYELEVIPTNRTSRRDDVPIDFARVSSCVTSASGDWLATLDSREGEDSEVGEISLKLWAWDASASIWDLNTRIDRPHGQHSVTSISFQPENSSNLPTLVSTGRDGAIKTWRLRRSKKSQTTDNDYWIMASSSSFRSEVPVHSAWSMDGSILAVTMGAYVVLYDPVTTAVLQVLTSAECPRPTYTSFVGKSGRYVLVSGHQNGVLWDLLTQSICWHHQFAFPINSVITHPSEESFLCLLNASPGSSQAEVYNVKSLAVPRTYSVPFILRNVIWYPPSTTSDATFTLVGITQSWGVVSFGDAVSTPNQQGSSATSVGNLATVGSSSIFQNIFGASAFLDTSDIGQAASTPAVVPHISDQLGAGDLSGFFSARSYLLPPMETMFDSILNTFLVPVTEEQVVTSDEVEPEQADEDVDMDDADSTPVLARAHQHRVVDEEEMRQFIQLFRQHAVVAPQPLQTPVPPPKINGVHSPSIAKVNGPGPRKQAQQVADSASIGDAHAPSPTTGKKRKKVTS